MNIEISYLEKTEKYIEENRQHMDQQVYQFLKQVCLDERRMIDLLQEQASQKKVLKP